MQVRTAAFFWMAAFFEIAGCFAFWAWLRLGHPAWWSLVGAGSLVLFALCLTRIDVSYAGRGFAAYGGVYIASSLAWLWIAEGIRPDRWDAAGALICLAGASVILWGLERKTLTSPSFSHVFCRFHGFDAIDTYWGLLKGDS